MRASVYSLILPTSRLCAFALTLLAGSAFGQLPPNNIPATGGRSLMVDINSLLVAPTNFFAVNSNLFNASVAAAGGGAALSGNNVFTGINSWTNATAHTGLVISNSYLRFWSNGVVLTELNVSGALKTINGTANNVALGGYGNSANGINFTNAASGTNVVAFLIGSTNVANITGAGFAGAGSQITSLTSANLTGALPAISGAALTSLNAGNISSGTLGLARGGTGQTTGSAAAQAVGIYPMSPVGGNNPFADYLTATPSYQGQLGSAWNSQLRPWLYAAASTTTGDWIRAINFPTGIAVVGSSNLMDVDTSFPSIVINVDGSPAGWTASGDSMLIVQNWSTNIQNSGGGFGIAIMSADKGAGPANLSTNVANPIVAASWNHVPSNRTNSLQPGNVAMNFNKGNRDLKAFLIGGPSLPGYNTTTNSIDSGNYSIAAFDLINHSFRVPWWHPNFAWQPGDANYQDAFFVDNLSGLTKVFGTFNVNGSPWNSSGANSNKFNFANGDSSTFIVASGFNSASLTSYIDVSGNGSGLFSDAGFNVEEKINGHYVRTNLSVGSTGNHGYTSVDWAWGVPQGFDGPPIANTSIAVKSNALFMASVVANAVTVTNAITFNSGPTVSTGSGSPNSAITAPVGSVFYRTDGGSGTTLYVKESGSGNTGWVGK